MTAPDSIGLIFSALADPTRRVMLARLAEGDATVNELAEPLAMTLPNVSKHVKALLNAGLITQGREGQRRPCRLSPDGLREVQKWSSRYIAEWEDSFLRLDALLAETHKSKPGEDL